MDKCPNCGYKLSDIDVLCPKCGSIVEVIQIKNNPPAQAPKAVSEDSAIIFENQVREKPKSFVVYNEDFPAYDSLEKDPSIEPEQESTIPSDMVKPETEESVFAEEIPELVKALSFAAEKAESNTEENVGFGVVEDVDPIADEYELFGVAENVTPSVIEDMIPNTDEDETSNVDEYEISGINVIQDEEYSQRYVDKLKDMGLPEIDDLSNFDPTQFMNEVEQGERIAAHIPVEVAPIDNMSSERSWLELEEVSDAAQQDVKTDTAFTDSKRETETAEVIGRRYKGPHTEKREHRSRRFSEMKNKKAPAFLVALLWIIVTVVFFFCFNLFDRYVKTSYGDYNNFIYSITDGKIDFGVDNVN